MSEELSSNSEERRDPVQLLWGLKIPMRDGVQLNATAYVPKNQAGPSPAIFTLTPYVSQTYHEFALYFARNGYPFVTVDVRGRGNSGGEFQPIINEGKDGHDIVEWLAHQSYCNGQVAMWGGSYAGHDQWMTAAEPSPHLATIVPVAAPHFGTDFPIFNNISAPYLMQWFTLVSGRASQDRIFADASFWNEQFREWFELGLPFLELDSFLGIPCPTFREWLSHPHQGEYWDRYNPSPKDYAKLSIPVLTITGIYDGDQLGALTHYREHLKNASASDCERHYLMIGPWDHAGTRTPQAEFVGLKVGPASLVDLRKLHVDWYRWVMQGGPKPEFLQKRVAYYVMGAEKWRYADTLEAVTARTWPLHLQSSGNPTDVFRSGSLSQLVPTETHTDSYMYDPRDVSLAQMEISVDSASASDQTMFHAAVGMQLIYHSEPFAENVEISGFFKLSAWIAIDQPDTDLRVIVFTVEPDGSAVQLTSDWIRARHRESLRESSLISTTDPLRYDFSRFTFVSRLVRKGSRLRMIVGPINSIYLQKNYNSGRAVAEESVGDARVVTVKLLHGPQYISTLHVPLGHADG